MSIADGHVRRFSYWKGASTYNHSRILLSTPVSEQIMDAKLDEFCRCLPGPSNAKNPQSHVYFVSFSNDAHTHYVNCLDFPHINVLCKKKKCDT